MPPQAQFHPRVVQVPPAPAPCTVDDHAPFHYLDAQVLLAFRLVPVHRLPLCSAYTGCIAPSVEIKTGADSEGKTLMGAAKTLQGMRGFGLVSAAGRDWQWRGDGLPCQSQEQI